MTENREKEWQNLQTTAKQMLDNPRLLPKDFATKHFNPTLHLWISPTFTPDKHWIFYQPQVQINPQPQPFIRQIIWDYDADFERFTNPLINLQEVLQTIPTFQSKIFSIDRATFENFHSKLSKISLPPFLNVKMNGCDGELCGVETLDYFYNAKISWWSEYPEEWKELVDWYEKTREFLECNFK